MAHKCPKCQTETIPVGSHFRKAFGALLVFASFLLFFPTIGVSFILGVYGVFMTIPRKECPSCKWHE